MAIALVQHAQNALHSVSSVTTTWPQATAAGNLLVAVVGQASFPGTISNAQGWTQAASVVNGTGSGVDIWYKANCGASEANPLFSSSGTNDIDVQVAEFSGCATASPLDLTQTATGANTSTATADTNPTQTAQASELAIGGVSLGDSVDSMSTPSNWVLLDQTVGSATQDGASAWHQVLAAVQTVAFTSNLGGSDFWSGALATFKGVGAAGDSAGIFGSVGHPGPRT
jgi:hypothetical protein